MEVRALLPFPESIKMKFMEANQKLPRNHTEQGIIDMLYEFGYIEATDDGSTWFTKGAEEYIIDRQLDLKDIHMECDKIYRYIENMGRDVYTMCRNDKSHDVAKIINAISEFVKHKKTYRRGILIGCVIGAVTITFLFLILKVIAQ